MIWVRRILTIPLILLFFVLFIVVLTITQVNGTFANPDFYTDQLRKADMYNFLYDEALPAALDEVETGDTFDFDIDIQAIEDDIVSAARKILPPEWLEAQVETAADTITPYILGDKDGFTYTVQFRDRVEAAAAVIKSDIIQGAAFDSLYNDGISYAADRVVENLGLVEFPYGLTVTEQDIEEALKKAIPEDWAATQANAVVDSLTAYIIGDTDHFIVEINVKDRVVAAKQALTDLASLEIQAQFNSMPTCSQNVFDQKVLALPLGSLPDCRPATMSYQQFKNRLGIDTFLRNAADQLFADQIPDRWTYTDVDLLNRLNIDDEETLNDIRGWIDDGYTLTKADIEDEINDSETSLESFDTARHRIDSARTWLWTLWLIPFALLVFIGLLGGRNWASKLAWGLMVLFLTSLLICVATVVTYQFVAEPRLEDGLFDPSEYEGVGVVMAEKGNEVLHNISSAFASGIEKMTLYFAIGSGVALLVLLIWRVILSRTPSDAEGKKSPKEAS